MRLNTSVVAIIVPVILFGGIGISAAMNMWVTESSKVPIVFTEGEFAGQANPADIRGSYSLGDIEKAFEVPVDVLVKAFGAGVAVDPEAFKVKELEGMYQALAAEGVELGTDSVRLFVALYKNLPYTPEETTVLPNPAVSQLKALGTLSEEQLALADEIKIDISAIKTTDVTHTEESTEDRTLKGMTTFGDLLTWGLTKEQIEEVVGAKMGARGTAMRDFFSAQGTEFSEYKAQLQALVDALPQ